MPVPPQMQVLWRFAPLVEADWNASYWDAFSGNDGYVSITSLTGTVNPFVISAWFETIEPGHFSNSNAYGWLSHSATPPLDEFYILRLRFSFSFSALPEYYSNDYFTFAVIDDGPSLSIDKTGHLGFMDWDYGEGERTTQAISAGQTYQVELYAKSNAEETSNIWQLYLDGELALEVDAVAENFAPMSWLWYGISLGIGVGATWWTVEDGERTVTLTVGDVELTIEDNKVGSGRWTMMFVP